ncbi:type I-G CRISPR-associated protein Cas8g1/Csx17 [Sorangium sp. So ce128]|uniref:type I-G CRISPR-associated protein Cas8g1/Csx17 n=1 Tax=Sorangium sp. So ce128 TaxID=3133281 RepID=UPI003F604724
MIGKRQPLPVVSCPGLHLDSLGHYLAALGLLEVTAKTWPSVRGAWREESFCLVGGPPDLVSLARAIRDTVRQRGFRSYHREWKVPQKRDTKQSSAENVAAWRSTCSEEDRDLVDAHIVTTARLCFNPMLGTGGNSGRRDFAEGWAKATAKIDEGNPEIVADLESFLAGGPCAIRGDYNGGSWFSQQISPWAMAFACEGLPLLAGSVSRRLGANTRRQGAFPFVMEAAAPTRENEAGRALAEVWAPVWRRPLAVAEVAGLFARGRAEVGRGRTQAATSAAAFAAAILQRGIDAGITKLRRFQLIRTTSSQTFESTLAKTVFVRHAPGRAAALAVEGAVKIREALPKDERRAKGWIFRGLRGPIDEALINLVARPDDLDAACGLLDALWRALERVDVNKTFRGAEPAFRLLPVSWLEELFRDTAPPAEATIAMALASLLPSEQKLGKVAPFLFYRLGVEPSRKRRNHLAFPRDAPQRRVWTGAPLERDLGLVLRRRLLDAAAVESPFRARALVPSSTIAAFLRDEVDDEAIAHWLGRMCLFDWQAFQARVPSLKASAPGRVPADGLLALYGFFKPLFHAWPAAREGEPAPFFPARSPATSAAAVARIAARLDAGDLEGSLTEARVRYRAAGRSPAQITVPPANVDTRRLLAALLIPTSPRAIVSLADRWLTPVRRKENSL